MNYEQAVQQYAALRDEIDALEREHRQAKAALTTKLGATEYWITEQANTDGITQVKTDLGLVYWSTHHKATVASREALFAFCKENDAWDLIESRASKLAVKSYIDGHGAPPPGVNYGAVRVFNFRSSNSTNAAPAQE